MQCLSGKFDTEEVNSPNCPLEEGQSGQFTPPHLTPWAKCTHSEDLNVVSVPFLASIDSLFVPLPSFSIFGPSLFHLFSPVSPCVWACRYSLVLPNLAVCLTRNKLWGIGQKHLKLSCWEKTRTILCKLVLKLPRYPMANVYKTSYLIAVSPLPKSMNFVSGKTKGAQSDIGVDYLVGLL